MRFATYVIALPLLFVLAAPVAQADDRKGKSASKSSKEAAKERKRREKEFAKERKDSEKEWRQRTEGHRPHDDNGDGLISRSEWPGNDVSFRELDWDGDGLLSDRDRRMRREGTRGRVYDRDGRWMR